MIRESRFQAELIKDLRELFPNCVILKNDPNYLQGFPDIIILFENKWAVLETKGNIDSPRRHNQEFYVRSLGEMSYASFVYPENKEKVLDELQQTFRPNRSTRLSRG